MTETSPGTFDSFDPVATVPIRPKVVTTVRRSTVFAWRRRLSLSRYSFMS